eukprot:672530-Pelagomonas_calceolata.AAC.2
MRLPVGPAASASAVQSRQLAPQTTHKKRVCVYNGPGAGYLEQQVWQKDDLFGGPGGTRRGHSCSIGWFGKEGKGYIAVRAYVGSLADGHAKCIERPGKPQKGAFGGCGGVLN